MSGTLREQMRAVLNDPDIEEEEAALDALMFVVNAEVCRRLNRWHRRIGRGVRTVFAVAVCQVRERRDRRRQDRRRAELRQIRAEQRATASEATAIPKGMLAELQDAELQNAALQNARAAMRRKLPYAQWPCPNTPACGHLQSEHVPSRVWHRWPPCGVTGCGCGGEGP